MNLPKSQHGDFSDWTKSNIFQAVLIFSLFQFSRAPFIRNLYAIYQILFILDVNFDLVEFFI